MNLSMSSKLSLDSMLFMFNNALTVTDGFTITLSYDAYHKLTEEQIAIATQKGFNVASA